MRQKTDIAAQPPGPGQVFQQYVGFEGRLVTKQAVLVGLYRPDDNIDRVVFHIHPQHVAGVVVIAEERLCTGFQVCGKLAVIGQSRSFTQQLRGCRQLIRVGDIVWQHVEFTLRVSSEQRIKIIFSRQLGRFKFLHRHVCRVKVCPQRFCRIALYEGRFVGQPVPGSIVQLGKLARFRVIDRRQKRLLRAQRLVPVQLVHDFGCPDQLDQHLLLPIAEAREVGRQRKRRVYSLALFQPVFPVIPIKPGIAPGRVGRALQRLVLLVARLATGAQRQHGDQSENPGREKSVAHTVPLYFLRARALVAQYHSGFKPIRRRRAQPALRF